MLVDWKMIPFNLYLSDSNVIGFGCAMFVQTSIRIHGDTLYVLLGKVSSALSISRPVASGAKSAVANPKLYPSP